VLQIGRSWSIRNSKVARQIWHRPGWFVDSIVHVSHHYACIINITVIRNEYSDNNNNNNLSMGRQRLLLEQLLSCVSCDCIYHVILLLCVSAWAAVSVMFHKYTVNHKKRATLFLIITLALLAWFFIILLLVERGRNTLQCTYLMAWWRHNRVTIHVTKVYFIQLVLKIKYVEFEGNPNFFYKKRKNVKVFLLEDW